MNFQHIHPVESSTELLDIVFRKAREKSSGRKIGGTALQVSRQKESIKLNVINDILISRLENILNEFPKEKELPPFYQALLKLTLDYVWFKKSCGAVYWARQKVKELHREYVSRINHTSEMGKIPAISLQFYGRVSSLLKQIQPELTYLDECRKIFRTYPDVQDLPTVCLYGFPNVGKTTLLNQLSGSRAKVAAYAFTTTGINAGYLEINKEMKIQILDVPGTLARPEKMNAIELQAELVVKELANVVVFVLDASEQGGYSLEIQQDLLKRISEQDGQKQMIVYLSKTDLLKKADIQKYRRQLVGLKVISNVPSLKEELVKMVGGLQEVEVNSE